MVDKTNQELFKILKNPMSINTRSLIILIIIMISIPSSINSYNIDITVGKINSTKTQIPKNFYIMDTCKPANHKDIVPQRDTIGELFTGDSYYPTKFFIGNSDISDSHCLTACEFTATKMGMEVYEFLIEREYTINYFINKIPIGLFDETTDTISYKIGIPIGYKETVEKSYEEGGRLVTKKEEEYFLYNHYKIFIYYNEDQNLINRDKSKTIVGASILPMSIDNINEEIKCSPRGDFQYNNMLPKLKIEKGITKKMLMTYDVEYKKTNIKYSSRWDFMLMKEDDKIHWRPIVLSIILTFVASFWVLYVFLKSVDQDIINYNIQVIQGDLNTVEKNWKRVCYDVFRAPKNRIILCSITGTGVQLAIIVIITLFMGFWGFLSPEHRAYLLNTLIVTSIVFSCFSGFFSCKFYRILGGTEWLVNLIVTALLLPTLLLIVVLITFIGLYFEESSAAPGEILPFMILYIAICAPFVLLGSSVAMMQPMEKMPCDVHQVPNLMQIQPWYLNNKYLYIMTGFIPFTAIAVEMLYLMASIWRHYYYNLFGFLFISLLLLNFLSTLTSIIVIHHQLNKEDYHWWWKSYFISGSSVIYFIALTIYYFFTLNIVRFSSILIYFSTMALIASILFLICGSVGFICTFYYIKMIYSRIKID